MTEADDKPAAGPQAASQDGSAPAAGVPAADAPAADAPAAGASPALGPQDGQPASSPAQLFAARRAELGMSLEDVAGQLKFALRQIEALEAGEFAKLPGGTFARGMVRSYARLLKIDPAPVLAQLSASGTPLQVAPEKAVSLRRPIPFSEGGKHVNLIYVLLSIGILAVVAFFVVEWVQQRNGVAKLAFVSATSVATMSGQTPAEAPAQKAPQAAAGPTPAPQQAPAALAPAGATTLASVAPVSMSDVSRRSDVSDVSRRSDVSDVSRRSEERGATGGRGRIVMQFGKDSWVEVRGGNGAMLMSQTNPAGSEKVIEGLPPFTLVIGNAASVRLTYNEQPVDLRPYVKVDVARFKLE